MALSDIYDLKLCGESLKNWQNAYGHAVSYSQDGKIRVLCEGRYQVWDDIKDQLIDQRKKERISSEWRYDARGLSKISYVKFKELQSTITRTNPNGHCYMVIKTKAAGFLGLSRHTYAELIDQSGTGYQFGMCGPTTYPLNGTKGAIVSPDPKEATVGQERRTKIIIPKEKFDQILAQVNLDKQNGWEYFHLFDNNCSNYVLNLCKEHLDLDINTKEFISQAAFRSMFSAIGIKPSLKVLQFLHALQISTTYYFSPFLYFIWFISGAAFDNDLGKRAKSSKPEVADSKIAKNRLLNEVEKIEHFMEKLLQGSYLKIATGWKLSVWQDNLKKLYGSDEVTLDQARQYNLSDLIALRC